MTPSATWNLELDNNQESAVSMTKSDA